MPPSAPSAARRSGHSTVSRSAGSRRRPRRRRRRWCSAARRSLILNDVVGITEVAGGDITKRRLEAELASLRAAQKLPWVEAEPARAVGLVAESLALHRERGTSPPASLGRWQP